MTQLAGRAVLSATLVIAVLALVLTTAGVVRPETAAADPTRVPHEIADPPARGKAKAPARPAARGQGDKRRVATHVRKRQVSRGLRAVQIANRLTGIPYVWGGASPRNGFDCSGLVRYVYAKVGISLPHYTVSQYARGRAVSRTRLRPGDLVFFYGLNHVGIYAGGGKYIHAPRSGTTVRWSSLAAHGGYYGARRIVAS